MTPNDQIKTLIVDFDGVLCSDYFYWTMEAAHPELYARINSEFFRGAKEFIRSWMKGQITVDEVHAVFAARFGKPASFFDEELRRSLTFMRMNEPLLEFIRRFRDGGGRAALLTDNMDVFGSVTVPHFRIDQAFDAIVTSYDAHVLKSEQDSVLLDTALERIGGAWPTTLVLDDWDRLGDAVRARGGNFFLFARGGSADEVDRLASWWDAPHPA